MEAETDDVDFNDSDPLIPAMPKRKRSGQKLHSQLQTCSSNQLPSSKNSYHLPSASPAPVSELKLKTGKVSCRFATYGSKVQGELVVGLDLQGTFVAKTESESDNPDRSDVKSYASTEKVFSDLVLVKYSIDPMHKWRLFKYSFVYIQISPTSLSLGNIFF